MTVEFLNPEPNGLATMVGELIRANLERDPDRVALLRPAVVSLTAPDAGVSAALRLSAGRVVIANGPSAETAHLRVVADSGTLLELTTMPLRFGLPDPFTADGRAIVRRLLAGEFRVSGMARHPRKLARLNLLMSVR